MGGTLRVDPAKLRATAADQVKVGTYVSGMATGEAMAGAGNGMPGLHTEGACQFASTEFDTATTTVHDELTSHSINLTSAADQYHHTDEELGRRLRTIANDH